VQFERVQEKRSEYGKALERLTEALQLEPSQSIVLDGVIQRFEFSYELAWKLIKAYLEYQGFTEVGSPRKAFRQAFQEGLIEDGQAWMDMLQDRNLSSHTYDEKQALSIYKRIKEMHSVAMYQLYERLGQEMGKI
jgi:nucleotidyltransferase substrate binding protein (TIGR01987 family)